jgi:hypothetical protein
MKPTPNYYTSKGPRSGREIINAPKDAFVVGIGQYVKTQTQVVLQNMAVFGCDPAGVFHAHEFLLEIKA